MEDNLSDLFPDVVEGFLRWLDKQLIVIVSSEVEPQEVESVADVSDDGLLLRQFQSAFRQERDQNSHGFLCVLPRLGSDNESNKDAPSRGRPLLGTDRARFRAIRSGH